MLTTEKHTLYRHMEMEGVVEFADLELKERWMTEKN